MKRFISLSASLCLPVFLMPFLQVKAGEATEQLKEHLHRNEMSEVCKLIDGSHPPIDRGAWNCLNRAKDQYGQDYHLKDDVAHLDFFRNRLAMQFQMPDVAIQSAIDMLEKTDSKSRKRGGIWECGIETAKLAVKQKRFESGLAILTLLAASDPSLTNAIFAVQRFTNAPTDIVVRLGMAGDFWVGLANWFVPPDYREAIGLLTDTVPAATTGKEKRSLFFAISQYAQSAGDDVVAEDYLHRLSDGFFHDDELATAIYNHAQFHFGRGEYTASKEWLLRVIVDGQTNSMTAIAHLGLAEVFDKLHEESEMLHHLELAAHTPPHATNRSIMDTSDTQQIALVRLGQYYQRKGEQDRALEFFREWQPRSWCGNGMAQFAWERDLYISQCLISLGKTNEALDEHLLPHVLKGDGLYWNSDIPKLIVRIFEERNALAILRRQLSPTNSMSSQVTATLTDIRLLRKAQNPELLIDNLKDSGTYAGGIGDELIRQSNWRAVAAAEALSELGGTEIPAIERRIETLSPVNRRWAAYALGLSGQPQAKVLLEHLAQQQKLESRDADYALQLCNQTAACRISKK